MFPKDIEKLHTNTFICIMENRFEPGYFSSIRELLNYLEDENAKY